MGARGFATETEARNFGEQLRLILEVAAVCSRLGVDVGQDKPSSWMNEGFARAKGLLQPHERIGPNIHRLMILPDDDNTRFPSIEAGGVVTANPAQLLDAMTELAGELPLSISAGARGVRLLNFALMSSQPLAQIVLAFSAVEALGQDETWTKAQSQLIEKLATEVEAEADYEAERLEVADALRRSFHRIGLRQGVMRVLSNLNLNDLRKEWDRLYGLRSGVFHGTVELTEQEICQLATDTVRLCGRITLAVLARDGVKLPSIANVHFGGA